MTDEARLRAKAVTEGESAEPSAEPHAEEPAHSASQTRVNALMAFKGGRLEAWPGVGGKAPIGPQAKPAQSAFRDGLLINLLNPKPVLFATAVLVVIFPPQMSGVEKVAVALNRFMVEVIFYRLLTRGMSTPAVRDGYLRAKAYIDRTASAVLGALGVKVAGGEVGIG